MQTLSFLYAWRPCPFISQSACSNHGGDDEQPPRFPRVLAGIDLQSLREDYRHRLFESYLPFWERGGIDQELGGFLCHLEDSGEPVDEEKNLWYQGRGLWVYSHLYNEFGQDGAGWKRPGRPAISWSSTCTLAMESGMNG